MIYELDGIRPQIDLTAWVAPTAVDVGRAAVDVSYTHFRANETVLVLVCRLLFEKKKNLFVLGVLL